MKAQELDIARVISFKIWEGPLSFVFEDFVEIGLQYFYFEKYQFANDILTYIKASFMVAKGFELTVRTVIFLKQSMIYKKSF